MPIRDSHLLLAAFAICVFPTMGCQNETATEPPKVPPTVIVAEVATLTVTDFDEYVGRTEATETVEVRARVSGLLQSTVFEDGQYVEADQLLATIEPDEYRAIHQQSLARIELAKSKLDLAQKTFDRAEKLVKSSAISKEEYDEKSAAVKQAEAEVVVAEADAARTALDVKYTEIRAPIAGRVDRAFVTPGNMVTGGLAAGTLFTRIVNNSPMYAYFDVDESSMLRYLRKHSPDPGPASDDDSDQGDSDDADLKQSKSEEKANKPRATLREKQLRCYLQLQDEPDFPHEGVLDFLETQVDSQTGTIRLRGVFANEDGQLQSGMYVRVRIPTSQPYEAVIIPESAIGTDQSYKFAFVVDDQNQAVRRTLTLGVQQGDQRVITDGIMPGETVIIRGVQRVQPGTKVNAEFESSESGLDKDVSESDQSGTQS